MRFLDTSAIVPLCVNEPGSADAKTLLTQDVALVVWWTTRTEFISALQRQVREGGLAVSGERQARDILSLLTQSWIKVQPSETVRSMAERLLAVHTLRAADAFQLTAALQWCQGQTHERCFLSFDIRLREAVYKEGFTLLPLNLPAH